MSLYSKFAPYYEQIFPYREATYQFLKSFVPQRGSKILDAGCGNGHYAGAFSSDGYPATGIDLDKEMIDAASRQHPSARFEVIDLREIANLEQKFDLVFCIGNTAAHIRQDQFRDFLGKLNTCLTVGATWIVQVVNWDFILQNASFRFPQIRIAGDTLIFLREYRDISSCSLTFHTTLKSLNAILFEESVTLYPIRQNELIDAHLSNGFELIGHFSDYIRNEFNINTFSGQIQVWRKR